MLKDFLLAEYLGGSGGGGGGGCRIEKYTLTANENEENDMTVATFPEEVDLIHNKWILLCSTKTRRSQTGQIVQWLHKYDNNFLYVYCHYSDNGNGSQTNAINPLSVAQPNVINLPSVYAFRYGYTLELYLLIEE